LDQDSLVRAMDPGIRIRIKMSWIPKTGCNLSMSGLFFRVSLQVLSGPATVTNPIPVPVINRPYRILHQSPKDPFYVTFKLFKRLL
jgi:hypothetical protein